jgi:hypothetical protein
VDKIQVVAIITKVLFLVKQAENLEGETTQQYRLTLTKAKE